MSKGKPFGGAPSARLIPFPRADVRVHSWKKIQRRSALGNVFRTLQLRLAREFLAPLYDRLGRTSAREELTRFIPAYICFTLILTGSALAQMKQQVALAHHDVVCNDSPIPGKRPANTECAILVRKQFTSLPPGPVVLRLETFPTTEMAQHAATPASAVVQAAEKVWLLTLGSKGEQSQGGKFVAEVGPLQIPPAPSYEIVAAEADLGPEANVMVHTHSGPEAWYLLAGEQCLELPDRTVRARGGEGMFAPADTPMKLNIMGKSKRDALFIVVHDAARSWNTWSDWQPKGLCQK
jgi:quercetin dioxygenase-like cupin family protein